MPNDWIKWEGGECPVEKGTLVDVKHRGGAEYYAVAAGGNYAIEWKYFDAEGCIIAYRLHQPEVAPASALQSQEGGDHYKKLAIQPMEYSMANKLDACQHTVVKYVTRFRDKGGIEDLKKAIHTIKLLAKLEYNEEL